MNNRNIPGEFICPITQKMMRDPVKVTIKTPANSYEPHPDSVRLYQRSFERSAIEAYFEQCRSAFINNAHTPDDEFELYCPVTNDLIGIYEGFATPELVADTDLQKQIRLFSAEEVDTADQQAVPHQPVASAPNKVAQLLSTIGSPVMSTRHNRTDQDPVERLEDNSKSLKLG